MTKMDCAWSANGRVLKIFGANGKSSDAADQLPFFSLRTLAACLPSALRVFLGRCFKVCLRLAAAAAFLERAVELTLDPARRAGRALAAAQAKHQAGAFDAALGLVSIAESGPLDELQRAHLAGKLNLPAGEHKPALVVPQDHRGPARER